MNKQKDSFTNELAFSEALKTVSVAFRIEKCEPRYESMSPSDQYQTGIIGTGGIAGMGILGLHDEDQIGTEKAQTSHAGGITRPTTSNSSPSQTSMRRISNGSATPGTSRAIDDTWAIDACSRTVS